MSARNFVYLQFYFWGPLDCTQLLKKAQALRCKYSLSLKNAFNDNSCRGLLSTSMSIVCKDDIIFCHFQDQFGLVQCSHHYRALVAVPVFPSPAHHITPNYVGAASPTSWGTRPVLLCGGTNQLSSASVTSHRNTTSQFFLTLYGLTLLLVCMQ